MRGRHRRPKQVLKKLPLLHPLLTSGHAYLT
jgi:hypothetical protein